MPFSVSGNQSGPDKISEFATIVSVAVLILHLYHYCHPLFLRWNLTSRIPDQIAHNFSKIFLLDNPFVSKIIVLGLIFISIAGRSILGTGQAGYTAGMGKFLFGVTIFFGGILCFYNDSDSTRIYMIYMILTVLGYVSMMLGTNSIVSIFQGKNRQGEVFNSFNESFPQEERLIENENSINLRTKYCYRGQIRKSWINIVNPMRGNLICGTPGSGKTHFVVEQIIEQHIRKGFAMVIYDFKYPDLSISAYNHYLQYKKNYSVEPQFHYLNFDDPNYSFRCNFLNPENLSDISDAAEFARAFLLGLNKEWIEKQGDFWVESPINLLTAIIWFLKKYENGRYCTFPHAIELL